MSEADRLDLTADRIRAYADLSGDHNPLHLDPGFAATTPFGGVIVHGSYALALMVDQLERAAAGRSLDRVEVRFTGPVQVGTGVVLHLTEGDRPDALALRMDDGGARGFLDGTASYAGGTAPPDPEQGSMT